MLERIAKVIKEYKETEVEITETTPFEALELDSLDMVEIVMSLEEEFDVTIEMNRDMKNIGDLMNLLKNA